MRHQPRHEKTSAHGTRLIAAALALIVCAVSLAAVTLLMEHRPAAHPAQERHGRPARPDVVAPRLDVPAAVRVRSPSSTGRIVRYRAVAVDETDGVVTASCAPGSGTRFPAGRTVVSCSAADRAGNVEHAGFAVHVRVRVAGVRPPRLRLPWMRCLVAVRAGDAAHGGSAVVVRTAPGGVPPRACFPARARHPQTLGVTSSTWRWNPTAGESTLTPAAYGRLSAHPQRP